MAVLALKSDEMADNYRGRPTNDHGKLRIQYFNLPAVAVAGDATTTIDLCKLPPGQLKVIPCLSRITTSAWGASRTLSIGHLAYLSADATTEAANASAFISAMDVSSAVAAAAFSTVLEYDIYSKAGVTVQGSVAGGTIPVGATMEGFIVYVYE
jgi:hypothetical protein